LAAKLHSWDGIFEQPAQGLRDMLAVENRLAPQVASRATAVAGTEGARTNRIPLEGSKCETRHRILLQDDEYAPLLTAVPASASMATEVCSIHI
jgi:hypothetical protein